MNTCNSRGQFVDPRDYFGDCRLIKHGGATCRSSTTIYVSQFANSKRTGTTPVEVVGAEERKMPWLARRRRWAFHSAKSSSALGLTRAISPGEMVRSPFSTWTPFTTQQTRRASDRPTSRSWAGHRAAASGPAATDAPPTSPSSKSSTCWASAATRPA